VRKTPEVAALKSDRSPSGARYFLPGRREEAEDEDYTAGRARGSIDDGYNVPSAPRWSTNIQVGGGGGSLAAKGSEDKDRRVVLVDPMIVAPTVLTIVNTSRYAASSLRSPEPGINNNY